MKEEILNIQHEKSGICAGPENVLSVLLPLLEDEKINLLADLYSTTPVEQKRS